MSINCKNLAKLHKQSADKGMIIFPKLPKLTDVGTHIHTLSLPNNEQGEIWFFHQISPLSASPCYMKKKQI